MQGRVHSKGHPSRWPQLEPWSPSLNQGLPCCVHPPPGQTWGSACPASPGTPTLPSALSPRPPGPETTAVCPSHQEQHLWPQAGLQPKGEKHFLLGFDPKPLRGHMETEVLLALQGHPEDQLPFCLPPSSPSQAGNERAACSQPPRASPSLATRLYPESCRHREARIAPLTFPPPWRPWMLSSVCLGRVWNETDMSSHRDDKGGSRSHTFPHLLGCRSVYKASVTNRRATSSSSKWSWTDPQGPFPVPHSGTAGHPQEGRDERPLSSRPQALWEAAESPVTTVIGRPWHHLPGISCPSFTSVALFSSHWYLGKTFWILTRGAEHAPLSEMTHLTCL